MNDRDGLPDPDPRVPDEWYVVDGIDYDVPYTVRSSDPEPPRSGAVLVYGFVALVALGLLVWLVLR